MFYIQNLLINRHAVKCVAILLMTITFCHPKTDILKLKNGCMNFKKYLYSSTFLNAILNIYFYVIGLISVIYVFLENHPLYIPQIYLHIYRNKILL